MKVFTLLFAFMLMIQTVSFSQDNQLHFIKNENQWESQIAYKSYIPGGALFLTNNSFRYSFYSAKDLDDLHEMKHHNKDAYDQPVHHHAYEVTFIGANDHPHIEGRDKLQEYHNYYIGSDPTHWASGVPLYNGVEYKDIYKGIDLSIYSKELNSKYDFRVKIGADPSIIQLAFTGVQPKLKSNGDLHIKTSVNEITELAPYAFQTIAGKEVKVECHFALNENILTYKFPQGYDPNYELIIDPIMIYKTYSGATVSTYGWSATYDLLGNLYSGGECFGTGWPVTTGAFQSAFGGNIDASINVYNPVGNALIYSTYYGGSNADFPSSLVVNNLNELVICGYTSSTNIPTTTGCFDNSFNGGNDIFVVHFNSTGTALIGATYMGGTDYDGSNNHEVNYDNNNDIIVASNSNSTNFPITTGCYQATYGGGNDDGVFFKLNPSCSSLIFSSYLGGTLGDECKSIRQNSAGQYVLCGNTASLNFPTTAGVLHPTFMGGFGDGFISIFNSSGNVLDAGTFLGTIDNDNAFRIQIDAVTSNIYVCGSSTSYPISPGVYSNAAGGVYIDKLNPTLTASILSTRIGINFLSPAAFLLDECNNVYVSCLGASGGGLPLSFNAYQTTVGGFWLCVLEPNYAGLLYATYMGASGDHIDGGSSHFDPQGIVYQSVCTISATAYQFPTSYSPNKLSPSWDVSSFKFDFEASGVNAGSDIAITSNDSVCTPANIQFVNNSTGATSYIWDFGDGSAFSTAFAPAHVYTTAGNYTVTLIANNPLSCVTSDTASLVVYIFTIDKPILDLKDTVICEQNVTANLNAPVTNQNSNMTFKWEPVSAIIGSSTTQSVTVDPGISTTFTVTVTDSVMIGCKEVSQGIININYGDTTIFKVQPTDTTICMFDIISLTASGGNYYAWKPTYQISDTTTAVVQVWAASPVVYSVLIKDIHGCSATRYVNIKTYPAHVDAGDDEIIRYGESIQLNATGAFTYQWQNDPTLSAFNIPDPVANPIQTTTYYVEGFTPEGCKARDSVIVNVTNAIVPNAFSPNGDGVNDIFRFKIFDSKVAMKSMRVFNRWGNEMFYSKSSHIGWDGKYKGKECDNAVYFYLIEYSIGDRTYVDKGDVTLLR